jgi:hypothetical protein
MCAARSHEPRCEHGVPVDSDCPACAIEGFEPEPDADPPPAGPYPA